MRLIVILSGLVFIYLVYVVYRVAEPFLTTAVEIELPKTATSENNGNKESIHVFVGDEKYFISTKGTREQREIDDIDMLVSEVRQLSQESQQAVIILNASSNSRYSRIVQTMAALQRAGAKEIKLVTTAKP
jgi:biopolymer transport protein ExbD